jgi:branched-chain amino acid transport system permease protein
MSAVARSWRGLTRTIESDKRVQWAIGLTLLFLAVIFPLFFNPLSGWVDDMTTALAYVVMALGLNIVVGFAGLLDLGYVAFFAVGAYTIGWFGSIHFSRVNDGEGFYLLLGEKIDINGDPFPGIHLNIFLVLVLAVILTALAGVLIGLPTLRLRGDYIAIVTLAFGEIIRIFVLNGDEIILSEGYPLTAGRKGINPVDAIELPGGEPFDNATDLRPWYWFALAMVVFVLFVNFRLRNSRLGRAWIAVREDEVAAASMGVPLVKTKLLAYGTGAAFGGISGVFLGSFLQQVNADQFEFSFSIFILSMIILGGLGSVWGSVLGALALSMINTRLIPDLLNDVPAKVGLDFDLTQLSFGIFGFLLVIMMILRPQGLLPERRRELELTEGVGTGEDLYEARG